MNNDQADQYAGQGGSYIQNPDGTRARVEEPTRDHPDGNKPRDAEEPVQTSATAGSATPRRAKNVNQGA